MKHLFKYKVTRANGYKFHRIFTINEIENGLAQTWLKNNIVGAEGGDKLERLPYVCDDKHGEPVYAGDRVRRVTADGCPKMLSTHGMTGIIAWHHGFLQWSILDDKTKNLYDLVNSEIFEAEIELIKDSEHGS